jgi:hypothetical protein
MSATVRVESGIAAGTSYWIDRPVLRIGSDPQCDICLPTAELAPHALTLEFRDGTYRVYNRGGGPVSVGPAALTPGANAVWNDGDPIVLPGNLQLALAVDGDPRPCPRPELGHDNDLVTDTAAQPADTAAGPLDEAEAKKKSSKTMVQLGVIAACVLAMAWFLTLGKGEETPPVNRPTFDALVRKTLAKDASDPLRAFLPRLQYAQAASVRNQNRLASTHFMKLRDQLVRQMRTLPDNSRADAQEMLEYVEYRLSLLK